MSLETGENQHLLPGFYDERVCPVSRRKASRVFRSRPKGPLPPLDCRFGSSFFAAAIPLHRRRRRRPKFDQNGNIYFRAAEGGSNFLYRMKEDGSDRVRALPSSIISKPWSLAGRTLGSRWPGVIHECGSC